MTVAELREELSHFDEKLEVMVRCTWNGEQPPADVFSTRTVAQDWDRGTELDFVALECDQEE
jgi:hypothetical protein